jgi:two-component system, NtrC family, response regulator AtoC
VRGRVLIVDDEPEFCRVLQVGLGRSGFEVVCRGNRREGMGELSAGDFDVVVSDINLRGESGLDLCAAVAAEHADIPVVLVTAFGSLETAIGAIRAGAYDFVTKPFEIEALELTLDRAVDHRRLKVEVGRLRRLVAGSQRFDEMIGASPPMERLFDMIRRVADTEASVLITGESGTGKEGIARAIHRHGRRRDGPFVAFNCAAVPESLLESEFFGHVRGAFTDARTDRTGLFLQADGGTLFLDEIGDLALALQPKLLRVIQERKVRPVGGAVESPFNARLVAATNHDLEEEVRAGRFREDLFFRVQVVHLEVPPLRMRGHDVLLLAQHFIGLFAAASGKRIVGLSSEAARKLRDYPWPGNVRELQNCVERAVALSEREEIGVADLPDRIRRFQGAGPSTDYGPATPLLSLEDVERRHILQVLETVAGNKSRAAKILGLDRKTLYRKLEAYGILAPGATSGP